MARKPTIYEALRTKIGREPTHAELVADVRRILEEASAVRAAQYRASREQGA